MRSVRPFLHVFPMSALLNQTPLSFSERERDEVLLPRRRTETCYSETDQYETKQQNGSSCVYAHLHFNALDGVRRRELPSVLLPQFSQLSG